MGGGGGVREGEGPNWMGSEIYGTTCILLQGLLYTNIMNRNLNDPTPTEVRTACTTVKPPTDQLIK